MVTAISLEIFKNLFISVAEEMGVTLGRTAYSPNIKERRDYSCALFDPAGNMIAQAAHLPVHLGSMPASVKAALDAYTFEPGDLVILNDPYCGGTHLPDITMVAPVFSPEEDRKLVLVGFTASRAHHADVGGMSPGSMPMSTELYQEGIIIPPLKLIERGKIDQKLLTLIYRNVRTPDERKGDVAAQLAAAKVGERRLQEIVARYGLAEVQEQSQALLAYSEHLTRAAIAQLPPGSYRAVDCLDDDGYGPDPVPVMVTLTVAGDELTVDFTGTSTQRPGCINAVRSVAESAVLYALRCLAGEGVPANQGCLAPVTVITPPGTIVNPYPPAAVAGGNVETSQRITDVLFSALAKARPDLFPAASQGTMNNLTAGGYDQVRRGQYAYYETMGGGMGARPGLDGLSGVHTHMSNTLNTPVEALEFALPLRVLRYRLREESGGNGRTRGGEGLERELEFLSAATVTLLTERRRFPPPGLQGGEPGACGENWLLRAGESTAERLPGKIRLELQPGDRIRICTPGGGGYGNPLEREKV